MNLNHEDEFNGCDRPNCDCGIDEELRAITFTRDELLYIDDNLTMMLERGGMADNFITVRPVQATAGLPSPVELLDKIGMAILQITDEDLSLSELTVHLTATDLYMLREIAKTTIKINGRYLGLELKRKIYKLLYEDEYRTEQNLTRLLADVDMDIQQSTPQTIDWSGEQE